MGKILVNPHGIYLGYWYQMGLSWAYPFGPSLVWVPSGSHLSYMGPICFLGADALGPKMVFHMGPMFQRIWDPCGSHMGLLPGLFSLCLSLSLSPTLYFFLHICASRLTFSSLLFKAAALHLAHCISMMMLNE